MVFCFGAFKMQWNFPLSRPRSKRSVVDLRNFFFSPLNYNKTSDSPKKNHFLNSQNFRGKYPKKSSLKLNLENIRHPIRILSLYHFTTA